MLNGHRDQFSLRDYLLSGGILMIQDDLGSGDQGGDGDQAILCCPAADISADTVNRLLHLGCSHIFVVITPERAKRLALHLISSRRPILNLGKPELSLLTSVEASDGVTTGISTHDRAATIRALADQSPSPGKLVSPGHIFPILASSPGMHSSLQLPEAAIEVMRLADTSECAVIAYPLNQDGELLDRKEQSILAARESLPTVMLSEIPTTFLNPQVCVHE